MLTHLRIQNFAIVDQLDVAFDGGLNVVTGETGAGKSILVEALQLVLGGRAKPEDVRVGADEAVVEALFQGEGLDARLSRLGLPAAADEVLVRRVIPRAGRGKVTINGALSTVGLLTQLSEGLVDLSGQHEHVALMDSAGHLALLDGFAQLDEERAQYRERYERWATLAREREAIASDDAERARRVDYLAYQLKELETLEPGQGEEEELGAERCRLASAQRLGTLGEQAHEALVGQDGGAQGLLARALSRLSEAQHLDPGLADVVEGVRLSVTEVDEAVRGLGRYLAALEAKPERLGEVDERLESLRRLARKHGVSVDGLSTRAEAMRSELDGLVHHEQRLSQLDIAVASVRKEALAAARAISRRRAAAAAVFGAAVGEELHKLALAGTRFEAAVHPEPDDLRQTGIDRVELLISTNPGEPVRPLARVASGGELSRVLLAIKRALAHAYPVDSYVFDEADAGIGGAVAEAVGRMLHEVAEHRQVFCITHLPQIAAFADHHYAVHKEVVRGRTRSTIQPLTKGEERQHELARMLAGAQISPVALEHAAHLLREGAKEGTKEAPARSKERPRASA